MAYKRNPMRSERICSLARYVMADALNAPMTASTQWFERTLDDSANRRITLPEAFLATDGALTLFINIIRGGRIYPKVMEARLNEEMPFMATENILMEAVKRGGDRQQLHELIRQDSMTATANMKNGEPCNLPELLASHPEFGMTREEIEAVLEPSLYIGRCPEQVENYLSEIRPLLAGVKEGNGEINL